MFRPEETPGDGVIELGQERIVEARHVEQPAGLEKSGATSKGRVGASVRKARALQDRVDEGGRQGGLLEKIDTFPEMGICAHHLNAVPAGVKHPPGVPV
jgi:hypothetical protein